MPKLREPFKITNATPVKEMKEPIHALTCKTGKKQQHLILYGLSEQDFVEKRQDTEVSNSEPYYENNNRSKSAGYKRLGGNECNAPYAYRHKRK